MPDFAEGDSPLTCRKARQLYCGNAQIKQLAALPEVVCKLLEP